MHKNSDCTRIDYPVSLPKPILIVTLLPLLTLKNPSLLHSSNRIPISKTLKKLPILCLRVESEGLFSSAIFTIQLCFVFQKTNGKRKKTLFLFVTMELEHFQIYWNILYGIFFSYQKRDKTKHSLCSSKRLLSYEGTIDSSFLMCVLCSVCSCVCMYVCICICMSRVYLCSFYPQKKFLFLVVLFCLLFALRVLSLDLIGIFHVWWLYLSEHIYFIHFLIFILAFCFVFFSILVPMYSNRTSSQFGQQETTCHLLLKELQVLPLI